MNMIIGASLPLSATDAVSKMQIKCLIAVVPLISLTVRDLYGLNVQGWFFDNMAFINFFRSSSDMYRSGLYLPKSTAVLVLPGVLISG